MTPEEIVARAMYTTYFGDPFDDGGPFVDAHVDQARLALAALREAGYRVARMEKVTLEGDRGRAWLEDTEGRVVEGFDLWVDVEDQ